MTYQYVELVTSMSSFVDEEASAPLWRTTSPVIVSAGVLLIIAGKLGAFAFCSAGAFRMFMARKADNARFAAAKQWAIVGCGFAVVMLFGGFMVVGETMYLMWAFPDGEHSAAAAFRYGGFIALIMIFIAQPEPGEA